LSSVRHAFSGLMPSHPSFPSDEEMWNVSATAEQANNTVITERIVHVFMK